MRTFVLVAFMAAYASAAKIADDKVDETADIPESITNSKLDLGAIMGAGDVSAGGADHEGDAISAALNDASAEVDGALPADDLAGGDDEAIAEGISDEALAASIDGALA